jgi:integrase
MAPISRKGLLVIPNLTAIEQRLTFVAPAKLNHDCLTKRATCHNFRHSFATHLLEGGYARSRSFSAIAA